MKKKAKVLFITPNLKGIKGGINRIQPCLGIGYLGAVLREAGYEVYIRDTALEGYKVEKQLNDKMILVGESDESIASYISNLNPDIIGISVLFSSQIGHAHTVAKIAKKINPEIKIVLGGNHISNEVIDYQFALKNQPVGTVGKLSFMKDKNIDFAMRGEVEYQFLELLDRLVSEENPKDILGLISRNNNHLCINSAPPPIEDINRLPVPARDLMNMEKYFSVGLFHSSKCRSKRVYNIMVSRGCLEKCTFCTTPQMWGRKVRCRNPQNVFEEIKEGIERYNIGEIQFEDDTLTANRKNLIEICKLIEPLGIPWCTPNGIKVNYHLKGNKQLELFRMMFGAGCYQVTIGCESGVQRVLDDIINKNLKLEQIKPSVENAKKAGLLVHTFWIVGYPGETREEMEKTIEFAAQVGADSYSVAILSPLPGTPIKHQVIKENLWWDDSLKEKEIFYRNSLIKVDGFNNPYEFEQWVNEKTLYLNKLLKHRDLERFKNHYGDNTDDRFLLKQT
jgi:anaerobic magnesium-protoporphyrin IX monomethyl ester cyclase